MGELSKQIAGEGVKNSHYLSGISTESALDEFSLNQMVQDLLVITALP
ncbi:MAG: hypothetical protein KF862_19205 [Chitinophagaceae bacterium]|nr:hypothetical protein [Chitinophagaceae bacterium]